MSKQPTWEVRESVPPDFLQLDTPDFILRLLYCRGFRSQDAISGVLSQSLKDLRSPHLMEGVPKALDRLIQAFKNKEKILIYGDYDMDGTSGTALCLKALKQMGFENLDYFQPDRFKDGYGLHASLMERFKEQSVDLILTVDLGITAVEACDRANELGMDVIITDHHLPQEVLPKALTIVNPNQEECSSEMGHLCGAGVIFYVCLALKAEMQKQGLLTEKINTKSWLDCFVIGTLTDMVPLLHENRILVKHGLLSLAQTESVGLQTLMKRLGLWKTKLSGSDVAIRMAPKLNALSRMGSDIRAIELFLCEKQSQADLLVDQVLEINEQRRRLQKAAENQALEQIDQYKDESFVLARGDDIHPGVLGLVATRLVQNTGKPSFVVSKNEGALLGSGRAPEDWGGNLVDVLNHCSESLCKFGGHAKAAGFELDPSALNSFEESLRSYDFSSDTEEQVICRYYDCEVELKELNQEFMAWLDSLRPFGQSFETPLFLFKNLKLTEVKSLKGGHFRLKLEQGGLSINGLLFSPEPRLEFIGDVELPVEVEVLAEPQWNFFAGRKSLQLLISDLRTRWDQ